MLMSIIDQINSTETVYDFLRYIVDHHDSEKILKEICRGEIFTSVHSWQYQSEINDGSRKLKVHHMVSFDGEVEDLEFDLTSLNEVRKLIEILRFGEQITLRDDWSLVYTCG